MRRFPVQYVIVLMQCQKYKLFRFMSVGILKVSCNSILYCIIPMSCNVWILLLGFFYYYGVMKINSIHFRGKKRSTDIPQYLAFMFRQIVPILDKVMVSSLCQYHSIWISWRYLGVSAFKTELRSCQIKYILFQAKINVILTWNIILMISHFQFNSWYNCMTTNLLLYSVHIQLIHRFWILNSCCISSNACAFFQ
jgi:hypothetical protein